MITSAFITHERANAPGKAVTAKSQVWVTSGFMDVTTAVVVGILRSMTPSAALLALLTVRFKC